MTTAFTLKTFNDLLSKAMIQSLTQQESRALIAEFDKDLIIRSAISASKNDQSARDFLLSCIKLSREKLTGANMSQQKGGYNQAPPQQQGGYNQAPPQQQGGYNQAPPQQKGGYNQAPPQQQGGYNQAPPQQQGGYNQAPPQQQGGYNQAPPQQQGGYNQTPPQQQGEYNQAPPQQQGGYNQAPPQQQGQTERDLFSHHVYGGKAALCFSADENKSKKFTVALEAASSTAPRSYDWANKIRIQLTQSELPVVLSVLLGIKPACTFKQHGEDKSKGFTFNRNQQQNGKIYCTVFSKQGAKNVPIEAPDIFYIASMFVRQMQKNAPWMDAQGIYATVRATISKMDDDKLHQAYNPNQNQNQNQNSGHQNGKYPQGQYQPGYTQGGYQQQ